MRFNIVLKVCVVKTKSNLLELEVTAPSRQFVRMELQRLGGEDEGAIATPNDTAFKRDIQATMIASATSAFGFMIWLDFTRKSVMDNDFLLQRPDILPNLSALEDVVNEINEDAGPVNERAPVSTKLVKYAQEIASVARKMLDNVRHGIVTVADERDERPIHGKILY